MMQQHLLHKIIPLHPALPESLRQRLAGRTTSIILPRPVRMRMRQPENLTVSQCAAKYRVVTGIDARPGPWRNDLVPHTVKVMDLFLKPWIKEIWLCWPERTAKTNVLLNCLATVTKCAPGNVFWLEPADDDGGSNIKTKIIPMFRQSPGLKKFLSPRADDTGKKLIAFSHGMHLFPASANSARTMANFFGKYNFGNEVDKYPAMVGTETDPIKLIRKRGRDDRGSKYMFASTPAGKYIYKGTMSCRQVWEYRNRCPYCGELVLMDDDHLDIPPGVTPDQVENGDVSVGYICNSCAKIWSEQDRAESYEKGDWHIIKGADDPRPRTVGTHASALPFPMIPLAEYCGKYLRSKTGELTDKRDYSHGYKVKDHVEELSERKEDTILRLRDGRPAGVVPCAADSLEISIDTQDHGFWYRIRAWKYGLELTSWLVKAGYVASSTPDDFSAIDAVLAAEYPDENGEVHRITAGIIDTQGHRTSEVYAWCRRTGVLAAAGAPGRKTQPVTVSRIDRFPGNGRPIPGGLALYNIDTHYHKDTLSNKLLIDPTDPGAMVLHSGYTYDQLKALERDSSQNMGHNLSDYAKQMCSEYRDERNLWQCPDGKANHLWDCESNGLALVFWLGWQHAVSEKAKEPVKQANNQQPPPVNNLPGWFNNR